MMSDDSEAEARLAIEVVVLWGGDTLGVSHFAAPSAVYIGEASDCGVALPAELLRARRRCIAVASRGDVCAVLPGGVRAWLTLPDGSSRPLDERTPAPERELAEPPERLLPLGLGCRAHLCFATLEVQVAAVRMGRACPRVFGVDVATLGSLGLTALAVSSLMAVLSRSTPPTGLNDDERIESAQRRLMHTYLRAAAARTAEPRREGQREPSQAAAMRRSPLRAASPEAAQRETPVDPEPVDPLDPAHALDGAAEPAADAVARRAQLREAARASGLADMLDWPELRDPATRVEHSLDGARLAAMQELFNPPAAAPFEGPGGLGLSGTGIGAEGTADVVALAAVGTAEGAQRALDRAATWAAPAPSAGAPSPKLAEHIVADPLAGASVRRAVESHRAALRACFADARGSGPTLTPLVRFVVRGNGQVDGVSVTEPSLSAAAGACIERVFLGLSVPNPVARPVQVAYRLSPPR